MTKMIPRELLDALLQESLTAFIEYAFNILNPSPNDIFVSDNHIRAIAHHLELVDRREIRRLAIALPPRHLKSLCASVAFPAWVLGRDPSRRIIGASYSADIAQGFSLQTRRLMEDPQYKRIFPATRFDPKRTTLEEIRTTRHGYRIATSVGGALTGKGGNILIVDDPLKAGEACSEATRESAREWLRSTLMSRLDNPKRDAIVLVSQRLHTEDLIGLAIEQGGWCLLDLPATAIETQEIEIGDGIIWTREPGEILQPTRVGEAELAQLRKDLGSANFEAHYQQRPVPPGGNLIKLAWFKRYDEAPPLTQYEAIVQSWDTAMVPGEGNAYSVCTTWGISGQRLYLLDVYREQLNYPDLRRAVVRLQNEFQATMVIVERASSGISLYQDLRRAGAEWIFNLKPEGDKASRLAHQSAKIEAGRVYLPEKAPWLSPFESEIAAFPNGKHDDQVDSLTQFLRTLDYRPPPLRSLSLYAG